MLSKKLIEIIEDVLPKESAIQGDKIGLQIQAEDKPFDKMLITYEITDDVINEAISLNCKCIVTFHPLIYSPLQSITDENRVGFLVTKLIKNAISVIAVHTTFDTFKEGTSKLIADKLEFEIIDFLIPLEQYSDKGIGIVCKPKDIISPENLLEKVYKICNSPLRYSRHFYKDTIETIAIVGGSGSTFLSEVLKKNIDAFITADLTYHKFHEVHGNIFLIDPGHYEMEKFVPEALKNLLLTTDLKNELQIFVSKVSTNPINYYPNNEFDKNNFLIKQYRTS